METNNTIKTTVELDATQAQQEIAKLNAKASDSTKSLEERLEAKNKQVEIQNKLSKKNIESIENEVKNLKKEGAELGKVLKAETKLNKAKISATKVSENNAKAQAKLSKSLSDSKDKFQELDGATGGVISSFKTLLTNPIGLFITAIVGAFSALKEAVNRSGKASETFGKIGAKLSGILNGLLAILEPVVEFIGDKLLSALNDPVQAFKDLGDAIQENFINRAKSVLVFGEAIAELFKGNFKEAAKLATDATIQFATGITDATDKAQQFGKEAVKNFNEASKATNSLANAERALVKNRIALEKQQLTSLRLAEEERQIRDDTSKTIEERIEANQRLGEILDSQLQKELALAQQSLNLAIAQKAATGDTIENLEAVGDAELKLLEIRERITGQRSEQLTNENSLLKEQKDLEAKKVEDELKAEEEAKAKQEQEEQEARDKFVMALEQQIEFDELELERLRENGEATNEIEAEIIRNRSEIELNEAKRTANERELIEAKKDAALRRLGKESEKAEKDKEQAILSNTLDAVGEAFGFQQEAALARQIIAAPEAVGEIFKTAAARPTIAGRVIHVATGLATVVPPIIQGIAAIKNTRFSKKKGGNTSAPAPSLPSGISGGGGNITPEIIDDLSANSSANLGINTNIGDSATATASNNVSATTQGEVVFSESKFNEFQNQVSFKEDKTTIS